MQETGRIIPGSSDTELRRVVVASALGTVFEWYDFFIYGRSTFCTTSCTYHRRVRA